MSGPLREVEEMHPGETASNGAPGIDLEPRSAVATELINRARGLRGFLNDHAAAMDEARQVTQEVFDALADAELLSVGAPAAFGGHDVDIDTMFEIGYELGRGCPSVGWCWAIWNLHSWYMGYAPPELQAEIYEHGPAAIIASSYNHTGAVVELTEGGCLLSGSWRFSSGIDFADWVMLGALLPGMVRRPGAIVHWMLVPRADVRVVDDWFVAGLKGSGSKSFVIDEPVFVPEHRFLEMDEAEYGPARTLYGRASYGVPNEVSIIHCTVSPFIGAAQASLDQITEQMQSSRNSISGQTKAESVNIQLRIGEAAAEIDAALSIARFDLREQLALGSRPTIEPLTAEQRARYRMHHCYNLLLARRAATRLFEISGSSGLSETSLLQRNFNDIYANSKHIFHTWDEHAENYGRVRLGLPSNALQG